MKKGKFPTDELMTGTEKKQCMKVLNKDWKVLVGNNTKRLMKPWLIRLWVRYT